jgi:hypothetical protein
MVSAKEKGDRREREARQLLEASGYTVETPNYTRFQNTDYFNLFDMMAFKPDARPLFIQVKSNRAAGINQFVDDCGALIPFEHVNVEFWVCHTREGWRLLRITADGYETLLDERKHDGTMGEHVPDVDRTESH